MRWFSVAETFGPETLQGKADKQIPGYTTPDVYTPKINPDFEFDPAAVWAVLLGMDCDDHILIAGPTGSGKSELVKQIAARLNYNYLPVNFNGEMLPQHFIGSLSLDEKKQVVYRYYTVPIALRWPGAFLVLEEWDTAENESALALQRVLEQPSMLVIAENQHEIIYRHPYNRIFATANTVGMGDETGLYSGVKHRNYSQINRFGVTIRMDYLKPDAEKRMLLKVFSRVNPPLKDAEAQRFCSFFSLARTAYEGHTLSVPFTHRDSINMVAKWLKVANVNRAFRLAYCNRLPSSDQEVATQLAQRVFGGEIERT